MANVETIPMSDAEEAHCRVMARVCSLPRQEMRREIRDLTLLATVTTAGPLALFAMGVGAGPMAMGLGLVALGAMGMSVRIENREHPRIRLITPGTETQTRWRRAAFGLMKGRHGTTMSRRSTTRREYAQGIKSKSSY